MQRRFHLSMIFLVGLNLISVSAAQAGKTITLECAKKTYGKDNYLYGAEDIQAAADRFGYKTYICYHTRSFKKVGDTPPGEPIHGLCVTEFDDNKKTCPWGEGPWKYMPKKSIAELCAEKVLSPSLCQ